MMQDKLFSCAGDDSVSGPVSKVAAHKFCAESPRGVLHRAFSVFLFDSQNRMLLTKRAATKITFPGVWTNACCSHPLFSQSPDEMDDNSPSAVESRGGLVSSVGAKHGAIRKLEHELGVAAGDLPHEGFRFLTRFHYWAADTQTYGLDTPWGEHEVDYIFFARKDGVRMNLNPDEVDEIAWVSQPELRSMLDDDTMSWSPWFRGIMELKGWDYWSKVDEIMDSETLKEGCLDASIHYFDPPKEFYANYNK